MAGLNAVIEKLVAVKIVGELWVDGSFLTEKLDPEDVDVVLRLNGEFEESCNAEQRNAIIWVVSDLHSSHRCHSFYFAEWPEDHPKYWLGHYAYCYWMRQWGFSRIDDLKGVAVVQLPGSDK
ncbi:MAG TPA: hypothetical protein VMV10_24545 [Pirellulales bacterium]|nr:hypothetical protein [Pirellulales bacterium]